MRLRLYLFSVFIAALPTLTQAKDLNKTISVDGIQREYIIHLPAAFSTKDKLPLIFAFHGGGGTAKGTIKQYDLDGLADENNIIIVYPNAIKKAWRIPGMSTRVKNADSTVNDLRFINLLLDTLIASYKVDDKKVFCTGISRGGMFSFYLADAMSKRITAIAPVCGGISVTMAKTWSLQTPMPALIINGTSDPLVNYNGGYGKLNKANRDNEDADLLPTEDLVKKIVAFNHCNTMPQTVAIPDVDESDGCNAVDYTYDCNGVKVEFIKIINGGHTWPGGKQYLPKFIIGRLCNDFSAAEKIVAFFMSIK